MPYNPDFHAAAYSTQYLQARSRDLLFKQVKGTAHQRNSPGIAGELATINAELAKRTATEPVGPTPRNVALKRLTPTTPRNAHRRALGVAPDADVARAPWPAYAPPVAPRTAGYSGYSGAVAGVVAGHNPKPHSEYC